MTKCEKCGCGDPNEIIKLLEELHTKQIAYHNAVESIIDSEQQDRLLIAFADNLKKAKEDVFKEQYR